MNRLDLSLHALREFKLPISRNSRALSCLTDTIAEALIQGNRVEIRGFGVFEVRDHNKRVSRNPRNGKSLSIPPRRLPHFKTAARLERRLSGKV